MFQKKQFPEGKSKKSAHRKNNEHRCAERWTALNYASNYPLSRSKARSQQQAQSHTTKIINQVCCCCAILHEGLCSLGTILLGNRVFMGRSAGLFPQQAFPRCPGRLFPQEACSNASWQKSLISEPPSPVQADLADDRVIVVLCSAVEAGALPQYFLP